MTSLKICCIASTSEASLALVHGASHLGLVSAMPSGPGVIDEALIATIAASIPFPAESWLLTSQVHADAIVAQHARCRSTALQLVDALASREEYLQLRAALPGVRLVQVIHVMDAEAIDEAMVIAPLVDAILLDSGNTRLAIRELGGTGRTHDWSFSRRIVESVALPVFLAGGLRPENVREAIDTVQPFGVDVCSGVRTEGRLDPGKLAPFARLVLGA